MAYTLERLKKAIDDFDTLLTSPDLAPLKIKLEFSLLQIQTALKVLAGIQSSSNDNHNKYLLYKQLEKAIGNIQALIQADSHDHTIVMTLAESSAFSALTAASPFLIEQQKEWLPHYLEGDLQTNFGNRDNKIEPLFTNIKRINSDAKLSGEQKTKEIENKIVEFTQNTTTFSLSLFKPKDALKSDIKAWLQTQTEAIINPLLGSSPTSIRFKKNSNNQ